MSVILPSEITRLVMVAEAADHPAYIVALSEHLEELCYCITVWLVQDDLSSRDVGPYVVCRSRSFRRLNFCWRRETQGLEPKLPRELVDLESLRERRERRVRRTDA